MAHRNARLNVRGRSLLVERVVDLGRPVAHVAKELGVSRQCAQAESEVHGKAARVNIDTTSTSRARYSGTRGASRGT